MRKNKIKKQKKGKALVNNFYEVKEVYATRRFPDGEEECFVSWFGYPPSQNSWVRKESVIPKDQLQQKHNKKQFKERPERKVRKRKLRLRVRKDKKRQVYENEESESDEVPLFVKNHKKQLQVELEDRTMKYRKLSLFHTVSMSILRKQMINNVQYSIKVLPINYDESKQNEKVRMEKEDLLKEMGVQTQLVKRRSSKLK